ncbi:MAG: ABC transporter permease [Candidatus Acidiferrales bacterium]
MRASNVGIIYRKELKDMLRDRKTLASMFLFPLILFPLMTVGFNRFEQRMRAKVRAEKPSVALLGAQHAPDFAAELRAGDTLEIVPAPGDYKEQISNRKLRAAVEFPAGFERSVQAGGEPPMVKIYYYQTESRSEAAAEKLDELLGKYRQKVLDARLTSHGLSAGMIKPIEVKAQNVAAEEKVAGSRFGAILPYFIIFLCFVGAMGPAIDLSAGEKERGTIETILASAVGRDDLVMGKFLLVLTVSLTTAVMSLLSYAVTLRFSAEAMKEATRGYAYTIGFSSLAAVFFIVLPMAVLFSATLLAVALLAKSYKEAQGYVSPLMILIILPAMGALIPGVDLSVGLALVPVLNVSLASRELFTGNFPVVPLIVTFVSSCVFAAVALYAAFKMFQTESVLFRT